MGTAIHLSLSKRESDGIRILVEQEREKAKSSGMNYRITPTSFVRNLIRKAISDAGIEPEEATGLSEE